MKHVVLKFGLGVVVLLTSAVLWWGSDNESTNDPNISPSEIAWERFPVLLQGEGHTSTQLPRRAEEAVAVFVYSPHQCYSNRNAMDGWHRAARRVEGVRAVNVLQDRSRQSARRYLNVFSTPYRTRLDSTGWFRSAFDLDTTPAIALLSSDGTKAVFYPTVSSLSDEKRRRHVSQLSTPTDS